MNDLKPRGVKIDELRQDPGNARRHDDRNVSAIARSLERFGQRRPLVVARGAGGALYVIAGNGTLEAARSLEWPSLLVTEVPADWDADKARAYALADNRTAELAGWDEDRLGDYLEAATDEDLLGHVRAASALNIDEGRLAPARRQAHASGGRSPAAPRSFASPRVATAARPRRCSARSSPASPARIAGGPFDYLDPQRRQFCSRPPGARLHRPQRGARRPEAVRRGRASGRGAVVRRLGRVPRGR